MFAKIFGQIFDSSIARDTGMRRMFQDLLILANSDGEVDMTPFAIAQRIVVPEEEVRREIGKLMQPDPDSRSSDHEGRRLIPIQAGRSWGWKIVNYAKYRTTHNEEARKERNRERKQLSREKNKVAHGHTSVTHGHTKRVTVPICAKMSRQEEEEEEEEEEVKKTTLSANSADESSTDPPITASPKFRQNIVSPPVLTVNITETAFKPPSEDPEAVRLYLAYPRRVARAAAFVAIAKAKKIESFAVLEEAVFAYAKSPQGRGKYCPYPASWFNAQRWKDDREDWKRDDATDTTLRSTAVVTDAHRQQIDDIMAQRAHEASAAAPPI